MPKVVIYTKTNCPYCVSAKRLFTSKNVAFEEINLETKPDEFEKLKKRTGMRTVPQIFINDQLIGGYSDLAALDEQKKLDALLRDA